MASGQDFGCLLEESIQLLSAQAVMIQTGPLWLSVGCEQIILVFSLGTQQNYNLCAFEA